MNHLIKDKAQKKLTFKPLIFCKVDSQKPLNISQKLHNTLIQHGIVFFLLLFFVIAYAEMLEVSFADETQRMDHTF